MKRTIALAMLGVGIAAAATGQPATNGDADQRLTHVPQWAREAVWYQLFVERFRNGDPTNDPTTKDIVDYITPQAPAGWKVTPWTQDWYKPDEWFGNIPGNDFASKAQFRRYGGDLQGVIDKLDYLKNLGITAIYFNPLNDSPSLHKFDATYWNHIDHNFGPAPEKDARAMIMERKDDPKEWIWTEADKLFLKLIKEAHARGIRIVMDYSWNHTGTNCFAFRDVMQKGEKSKYKDWYFIDRFDNPATPENEFSYQGWSHVASMPEIRETVRHNSDAVQAYEGNIYSQDVKNFIFNTLRKWAAPYGVVEDGIDGMRLDVAGELPLGFWREFRKEARSINPEFYIIGEIWWEKWPDKLLDPRPFVKGDVFDANMNYRWFRTARHFFNDAPDSMKPSDFVTEIDSIFRTVRPEVAEAYMNMSSSHDAPRLLTAIYNKNKYKYQSKPYDNPNYKINKPDEATRQIMEQLLIHQFTFVGAPQIWNGDEMGMWGGDDPDDRKPLIWPDYQFEDETTHPLGLARPTDKVAFDSSLFKFYQRMIKMRKSNPVFEKGDYKFVVVNNSSRVIAYSRTYNGTEALVVFNRSNKKRTVKVPATASAYTNLIAGDQTFNAAKSNVVVTLEPGQSAVLLSK